MKVNFKCFTRYYKTGKREKYDKKKLSLSKSDTTNKTL